jgi:thermitase
MTMDRPHASTPLLTARGYRRNGLQRVDLFWSGSSAHDFHVYRDGERIATVSAGPYRDELDRIGAGSYRYHVTEGATATCSNDASATFRGPGRSCIGQDAAASVGQVRR